MYCLAKFGKAAGSCDAADDDPERVDGDPQRAAAAAGGVTLGCGSGELQ